MKRTAFPAALALTLALGLGACGAGNESDSTDGAASGEAVSGKIKGAGASTQENAQTEWINAFGEANSDATVEYSPDGSGAGRDKFISGAVDFAGSDSAMDEEEMANAKKKGCKGETIQFPVYVAPIAVAYNLEGVDSLNLSADVVAEIFEGKIKKWNDPKIAKENEGVELPDTDITPVNRSDDSGTSKNFSAYLGEAAPKAWTHEPDDVWPIKGKEAAKGTSGVVDVASSTDGAITYADASQIGDKLKAAKIKSGEEYIAYSPEAAAKILDGAERAMPDSKTDYSVKLDRGKTGAGVYPVVLVSYAIACSTYDDAETAKTVKSYLEYVSSEDGQKVAGEAGAAPMPTSAVDTAKKALENIETA